MFKLEHPRGKRLFGIRRYDPAAGLRNDGTGIDAAIDIVHRAAMFGVCAATCLLKRLQCSFMGILPLKTGQKRGVNIDDLSFEALHEIAFQNLHVAGKNDEAGR